mmetsp:Transcript_31464/g.92026  ORF Transcript_31464/g.92026 Transcript_31464/m.92026 type:complete len:338 (-) Transcript_31464:15-1028(-)
MRYVLRAESRAVRVLVDGLLLALGGRGVGQRASGGRRIGTKNLLQSGDVPHIGRLRRLQARRVQPALDGNAGALAADFTDGVEGLAWLHNKEHQRVGQGQHLLRRPIGGRAGVAVAVCSVELQTTSVRRLPLFLRVCEVVDEGHLPCADDVVVAQEVPARRIDLSGQVHPLRKLAALGDSGTKFTEVRRTEEVAKGLQGSRAGDTRGGRCLRAGLRAAALRRTLRSARGKILRLEETEQVRLLLRRIHFLQLLADSSEFRVAQERPQHHMRERLRGRELRPQTLANLRILPSLGKAFRHLLSGFVRNNGHGGEARASISETCEQAAGGRRLPLPSVR